MVRAMCRVLFRDKKMFMDLMLMLGFIETIDQLTVENSVRWHDHMLRREDGHVFRMVLDLEVEGQSRKGWLNSTWKNQVKEEYVKVGLRREDVLRLSKWSVGVNLIAAGLRRIWPPLLVGGTTRF